uniref:Protein BIC1 n=2 Tax=Cucumis melo TaxID=3656 RepID=A0A9I9CWF6_CUCME
PTTNPTSLISPLVLFLAATSSSFSSSLFKPLPWRTELEYFRVCFSFFFFSSEFVRKMDVHVTGSCLHQYSLPPPPFEAVEAPPPQKEGTEQELDSLVTSLGGCRDGEKGLESDVQEDDGAEMEVAATVSEKKEEEKEEEEGGRERLKRHRREMAGRVWIPEIWGQEELLKDWIDCSAFDACLFPTGIGSARAALVEERRRANNGGLTLENRC